MKLKHLLVFVLLFSVSIVQAQPSLGPCGGEIRPITEYQDFNIRTLNYPWRGADSGQVIHLMGDTFEVCSGGPFDGTVNEISTSGDIINVYIDDQDRDSGPDFFAHSSGVWEIQLYEDEGWERTGLENTATYDGCGNFASTLNGIFRWNGTNWSQFTVNYPDAPQGYHSVICNDEGKLILVGALGRDGTGVYQPLYNSSGQINNWYRYDIPFGVREMVWIDETNVAVAVDAGIKESEQNFALYKINVEGYGYVSIPTPFTQLVDVDTVTLRSGQTCWSIADWQSGIAYTCEEDLTGWEILSTDPTNSVEFVITGGQLSLHSGGSYGERVYTEISVG